MLKIRRPLGRLIFNMGIAIPGKTVFLIETAPRVEIIKAAVATFFTKSSKMYYFLKITFVFVLYFNVDTNPAITSYSRKK